MAWSKKNVWNPKIKSDTDLNAIEKIEQASII